MLGTGKGNRPACAGHGRQGREGVPIAVGATGGSPRPGIEEHEPHVRQPFVGEEARRSEPRQSPGFPKKFLVPPGDDGIFDSSVIAEKLPCDQGKTVSGTGFSARGSAWRQRERGGLALVRGTPGGRVRGVAMFLVISLAVFLGVLAPVIFQRVGIDPAVASAPFITTANDILGLFIYLGLATTLIEHVM